jgi:RND family efflux transporter MFP subunit
MMRGTSLAGERSIRLLTLALGEAGTLILASALAACHKEEKAASQSIRPVRTVAVELQEGGEKVSLTGEIQPRFQANLGFRVNGKILERPVDVGTQVKTGDLLARLDPQQYKQELEVAKSEIAVAEAEVTRSRAQEYRQCELLKNGRTTQVAFDQALKTFKTAEARLDAARARQVQASENLGYTELKADNDGVITAIGADPGQVVSAGQMVVAWRSLGNARRSSTSPRAPSSARRRTRRLRSTSSTTRKSRRRVRSATSRRRPIPPLAPTPCASRFPKRRRRCGSAPTSSAT